MRKSWLIALVAIVLAVPVSLRADVTITTVMTIEGTAAGMAPGQSPSRMIVRIKGLKMRTDIEAGGASTMSSIADAGGKQVILLDSRKKTARILDAASASKGARVPIPKMDGTVEATGQSRVIDGVKCDEYVMTMTMSMAEMSGAQMPPEAAEMMKDVQMVMNGTFWVSKAGPGAADYMTYYQAAAEANIAGIITGAGPGVSGGLDRMMAAASQMQGIPYLTEMTMSVEGSGGVADMMRKMGAMKMTMKVASVSTEPVDGSVFAVPAGYQTVK